MPEDRLAAAATAAVVMERAGNTLMRPSGDKEHVRGSHRSKREGRHREG